MEKIGSILGMKPKRRCLSRRGTTRQCVINVAEARKEIAHALQLHRSLSSQSQASSSSVAGATPLGNTSTTFDHDFHMPNYKNNVYSCYSLMESMPMPEPIWSTTEPSVLAASSTSTNSKELVGLEFEFGDDQNQASSYTWWVGFLKSLDGNSNQEITKYPKGNSVFFGQCQAYSSSELVLGDQESPNSVVDASDESVCSPDEWLLFPTAEDEGETNPIP